MRCKAAIRGQKGNIARNKALHCLCDAARARGNGVTAKPSEVTMATTRKHDERIVETTTEARQGEAGPSVLALLSVSTGLAVLILGILWFVFFRV